GRDRGGQAPRPHRQRRARRSRAAGRAPGDARGRADARIRSRSPRDRERTRLLDVAQTKRKRQTKHRGNAAGVVESRGRTGRKPTAAEKSGKGGDAARAKQKRPVDKRDLPPTWRGA